MLRTNEQIIKHKVGLLNLAEELGTVSKPCRVMGLSRDTFCRSKQAVEAGGVEALLHKVRRQPNPKNRVDERTEASVLAHALDFPAHGQVRTSNELRKTGVFVSPSGVRSIWLRHSLAHGAQLPGRLVGVTDGDTVKVLDATRVVHKIRLAGIDAPERKQPFGTKAKQAMANLVFDHPVLVEGANRADGGN